MVCAARTERVVREGRASQEACAAPWAREGHAARAARVVQEEGER